MCKSAYELQRDETVKQNEAMLKQLGLAKGASAFMTGDIKKKKKKKKTKLKQSDLIPTRQLRSAGKHGEDPYFFDDNNKKLEHAERMMVKAIKTIQRKNDNKKVREKREEAEK